MRVRGFTQDDAHIFCMEEQVQAEVTKCIEMVYDVYKSFGFEDIIGETYQRVQKTVLVVMKFGIKLKQGLAKH